jgi:hypothetical protein
MDKTDPFDGLPRKPLYRPTRGTKPVTAVRQPKSNTKPVRLPLDSNKPQSNAPESNTSAFDKKAYQRDLMRKRRAAAKATS